MSIQVTQDAAEAFFLSIIGVGLLLLQIGVALTSRRAAFNYANTQIPKPVFFIGFSAVWVISATGLAAAYYIAGKHWGFHGAVVSIAALIAFLFSMATFLGISLAP